MEAGEPGGRDQIARLTPYELVFGEARFEARTFPRILTEAEEQGLDSTELERFGFLSVGAETVREVIPTDAPPEAFEQYRLLLYHAFNFWRFGKRLYCLEPAVARFLVEAAPELGGWELRLPHQSVYVQLPANLFWASVAPDVPPEPVDGFFACCTRRTDAFGRPFERLQVLLVLGIRRNRAGFSLISFDAEVVPGITAQWTETAGREEGRDFRSLLPGGELAGLYSVLTIQEALKLVARALWYVDRHPGHVSGHAASERRASDRPGSAPLSHLPFQRVSLHEDDGGGAAAE
jgi:hypothetical protein